MQLSSWGLKVLVMDPNMVAWSWQPFQVVSQSTIGQNLYQQATTSPVIKPCKHNQGRRNASVVAQTTLDYLTTQ